MSNLAKGLHDEIIRNKELLVEYQAIGPPGQFGATMIMRDIKTAEDALDSGEVTKMVLACKTLQDNK